MEMWAIVDEKDNISKILSEKTGKDTFLIFKTEKEAEEELKDIIKEWLDELVSLKEDAIAEGNRVKDYEEYDIILKWIEYYKKCSVKKIRIYI